MCVCEIRRRLVRAEMAATDSVVVQRPGVGDADVLDAQSVTRAVARRRVPPHASSTTLVVRGMAHLRRLVAFVGELPCGGGVIRAPMPFAHASLYSAAIAPCGTVRVPRARPAASPQRRRSPRAPVRAAAVSAAPTDAALLVTLDATTLECAPDSVTAATADEGTVNAYRIVVAGVLLGDSVRALLQHVSRLVSPFTVTMQLDPASVGFNAPRVDASVLSPPCSPRRRAHASSLPAAAAREGDARLCDAAVARALFSTDAGWRLDLVTGARVSLV
jgi:hypothetical protein